MKLLHSQRAMLRLHRTRGGFWVTLLIYAALFVISELLRPKPDLENAKPAGLGDFTFPTATEDRVVPLIWGTMQISGPNVIWYGDFRQRPIQEKVKTGLFSSETITKGFKYDIGIQFGLCRGPVDELLGVWIGDKRVFNGSVAHNGTFTIDRPNLFGGDELGTGGVIGTFRFFEGNETQAPSTYIDNFQLEGGETPAYRGTCYIAPSVNPTYIGNSTTIKPWKFELRRIPNGLGLITAEAELNSGNDANPANVLYELFTNTDWGLGQPAADINVTEFSTAAATLAAEGNGFSYILDRQVDATVLIDLIEQQISGKVFFDHTASQWTLRLARADYNILTIPEITEANALEIKDFTRGSWEDTTNIVRTKFNNRANEYGGTFGLAQDTANIRLQGGVNVSTTLNTPGIKDAALANQVAWRTLRTLSYPLAKATFIMDRTFWDTNPVDVFAFTSAKFDLQRMPMRVTRVDLGDLENNQVTINVVQDIFFFQVGSFGDPPPTDWTDDGDTLLPFLAAEQVCFEAPRGFVARDPVAIGLPALIWAGARRRGNEATFKIVERHDPTTPTGDFNEIGESFGLLLIGELNSALASGQTSPTTSIIITNVPDSQADLLAKFEESEDPISGDSPSADDIGTNLINLVYVWDGTNDGEFMLVTSAIVSGGSNINMQTVYRGVLDTAQQAFSAGDQVFLVFAGGNNSVSPLPETDVVHAKLLPRSTTDQVLASAATQITFTMAQRVRRPYCPSQVTIGATVWATTVSLEHQGSGLDGVGFAIDFIRRNYTTGDEIPPLTIDAATLDAGFPAANNTTHDMELREDPQGGDVLLITDSGITGASNDQLRTAILHANLGVLPTRLRVVFDAIHDDGGDTGLASRQQLIHDFDVTSSLTGDFEFGDLDGTPETSATYTVDAAGVHNFTIGTAFATTGNVEQQINGGGWTTLIAQGGTTGATASLSVSDTLEIRHDSVDSSHVTHIEMIAPGGGTDAWGILFV